jgi:hypothetical protein
MDILKDSSTIAGRSLTVAQSNVGRNSMMRKTKRIVSLGLMMALCFGVNACADDGTNGLQVDPDEPKPVTHLILQTHLPSLPSCLTSPEMCGLTLTPPPKPPVNFDKELCPSLGHGSAGTNPTMLAQATRDELTLVRANADIEKIALDDSVLHQGAKVVSKVLAMYSYIAVNRQTTDFDDTGALYRNVLTLHTSDGEVLWTLEGVGYIIHDIRMAKDGTMVVRRAHWNPGQTLHDSMFIDADGQATELADFSVYSAPILIQENPPIHVLPVYRYDGEAQSGWLRVDTLEFQAVWTGPKADKVRFFKDRLFLLDQGKTMPWLWASAPLEEATLNPTSKDLPNRDTLDIIQITKLGWALVYDSTTGEEWRIKLKVVGSQLQIDSAHFIDRTPPAGTTTVGGTCIGNGSLTLDSKGYAIYPFRDDSKASAYRMDPSVGTWEPIGAPLTKVIEINVVNKVSTYVVRAMGENQTFCPPASWTPPADNTEVLTGSSVHVTHPHTGNTHFMGQDKKYHSMHFTGLCFATMVYGDNQSSHIEVVDVMKGTKTPVDIEKLDSWIR